jgi:thioredoxin-like negative regulator of GroEL
MSKQIITEISSREVFLNLLKQNTGLIILKLGAEWCGPCKTIKSTVHNFFAACPEEVICADIDVDVCYDLYSFLKSKKMVNGIPVILCYIKGNVTYIPDDSITGSNTIQLNQFFIRCAKHLSSVLKTPSR